jgi:hypothetical protein
MGESRIIGKDHILCMGEAVILFDELFLILNQRRVCYLYQASSEPRPGMICSNQITSEELELERHLALEWETFRRVLINFGV